VSEESARPARAPIGPISVFGISIVVGTIIVDQVTKLAAEAWLPYGEPIPFLPILTLFRTYNPGIAFSLFNDSGPLSLIALTAVITAVVLVVWWRAKEQSRVAAAAYALILGGAIGNFIDRVQHGHVIDFLLLHLGGWNLFVFNLADAALSAGPAMLILIYLFRRPA